ncbi:uncharacterized protein [Elaeis guineensis]|uniref:Uncharacterized protein LOC105043757 n=1 Tax=Elaeis guineensis var. tenera TaxID=51953 RepID=A0A6I9R9L8_ELAGV|nr:uncharacterized protein LOC105043757 [Elaeis guineensis]
MMAAPNSNPTPAKLLHIDALQTVAPARMAKPGQSRRISVADPFRPEILQSYLQIILYYKKAREEESASVVAAWIKESLNVAVADEPLLAGRLWRDDEGDGRWEIKFNDAGVRLVQASAEMTMAEFLGSKERDGREGQLAYWVDVDKENPRYSALFYIQVTEFQGDGYSIGISCSLLLADPLFLARFLKSWAQTHSQMLAQGQISTNPLFHLGYFQRPGRPTHIKSTPLDSISTNPAPTTTMLFKVARARDQGSPSYNELAILCLMEATKRIEGKATSNFTLIVSDHAGDLKIESCSTEGLDQINKSFSGAFSVVWWDELGIEEMAFDQGNRPIHAFYRVVSCVDEGHVIVMLPSDEEDSSDLMISTTIPKKI